MVKEWYAVSQIAKTFRYNRSDPRPARLRAEIIPLNLFHYYYFPAHIALYGSYSYNVAP